MSQRAMATKTITWAISFFFANCTFIDRYSFVNKVLFFMDYHKDLDPFFGTTSNAELL